MRDIHCETDQLLEDRFKVLIGANDAADTVQQRNLAAGAFAHNICHNSASG
jgi:hypothetical protein